MAAPLVVSFWMRAAITLVDTIYAALVGDAAVAAVGLTIPLEFMMIAVWVGLSTGLTSNLSRAMGAEQHAKVAQYIGVSWRMVAAVAPLFTLVAVGVWAVAPHMGLDPEVGRGFRIYGTVLIGGSAFTTFWSIIPDSLIKAHHDTRSTMWAGIWSNVINLGLNTLFIFVFGWGLFGIALSTVLGRIGGLIYSIVRARHHESLRLAAVGGDFRTLDPAPGRSILDLAVPSSLTFALMATESAFVNALLARMAHATEAIAAYSIYYRMVLFAFQPVIASSVAMLPYAARLLGTGDHAGVRRGLRQIGAANAVYSLIIVGPAMFLGGPWIARRLAESPLTADYTQVALRLVPLACLVGAPFLLCRPVFEAMQQGRPGLIMALLRYIGLTAPLSWVGIQLARRAGVAELYGLMIGLLFAAALSSGLFAVWLRQALRSSERQQVTEPS
jgi:Na+-driven multidrug efflux pump